MEICVFVFSIHRSASIHRRRGPLRFFYSSFSFQYVSYIWKNKRRCWSMCLPFFFSVVGELLSLFLMPLMLFLPMFVLYPTFIKTIFRVLSIWKFSKRTRQRKTMIQSIIIWRKKRHIKQAITTTSTAAKLTDCILLVLSTIVVNMHFPIAHHTLLFISVLFAIHNHKTFSIPF